MSKRLKITTMTGEVIFGDKLANEEELGKVIEQAMHYGGMISVKDGAVSLANVAKISLVDEKHEGGVEFAPAFNENEYIRIKHNTHEFVINKSRIVSVTKSLCGDDEYYTVYDTNGNTYEVKDIGECPEIALCFEQLK